MSDPVERAALDQWYVIDAAADIPREPKRNRLLGREHEDTLAARRNFADWTYQGGEPRDALRTYQEVLFDQARIAATPMSGWGQAKRVRRDNEITCFFVSTA